GRAEARLGGGRLAAVRAVGATGKPDQVVKIPTLGVAPFPLVVATGLGPAGAGLDAEQVRRAVGAAVRTLDATARVHVAIGDASTAAAAAEGELLGSYTYTHYQSQPKA